MAEAGQRGDPVHVALLRGINVGGRNTLRMADLAGVFEAAGCRDVRTYIQSGNVLFGAGPDLARRIPALVAERLAVDLGLAVPVVVRSARQLRAILDANPYLAEGADVAHLHVGFLAGRPTPARIARLDPQRSPPDRFVVLGREIHLHCPNGVARSKLTNAWFDRVLQTTCTVRNGRTVLRLLELADR